MRAAAFDAFLLDLDGVVYIGDQPLPGAVEALARLREDGKRVRFVTNDPRPTRDAVRERLEAMGVQATTDEVFTVGWASARLLEEGGAQGVYVVGSPALVEEVERAGVRTWTGPQAPEGEVEVVLVGTDEETSYAHIQVASRLIRGGARFLATNMDGSFPTPDGPQPATGAIAEAVRAAADQAPTVVGKPEPLLFELATEDLPPSARVLVVGDTLGTDVLGAHRAGFPAALVGSELTGTRAASRFLRPDVVAKRLDVLLAGGGRIEPWEPPGHRWPDHLAPGVGMVVFNDDGQVLLHRRTVEDAWAPPSGHVERGETVEDAALRELAEETGLDVELGALVGVVSDPAYQVVDVGGGGLTQFVTTLFRVRCTGGSVKGSEEATAWDWFEPDQLPSPLTDYAEIWIQRVLGSG